MDTRIILRGHFYCSASSAGNKILNADRGQITELEVGATNIRLRQEVVFKVFF